LGEPERGGMIWAHGNGATKDVKDKVQRNFEIFFVGTEKDYKTAARELGPTGRPLIGPLQEKQPS
jgi:hypothetical protein